jgi:truncated hemoglobin YjbI
MPVEKETTMSKTSALKLIKALREAINDCADPTEWQNEVLEHLDRAADVLEFPKTTDKQATG